MTLTSMTRSAAALALFLTAGSANAQQPTPAPVIPSPEVGTLAPDFAITGATRYGVLRDSIHLRDYKGKTVVLAFFFKARTKG